MSNFKNMYNDNKNSVLTKELKADDSRKLISTQ